MSRTLFPLALLLAVPTASHAQFQPSFRPTVPADGFTYGFGGGFARPAPLPAVGGPVINGVPNIAGTPVNLSPFHGGRGIVAGVGRSHVRGPGFPFSGVWRGGYGFGGYYGYDYGYGYGMPLYAAPVQFAAPAFVEPAPERTIALANEFPATLVMEFPAPAEVWVNGKKGDGEPNTEWTLTSPVLKAGGEFTFEVKARWASGGKTFEYTRSVTVAGGQRSRALVVSGTEIKE
jgi:uncharacterized protein (TIGR03000 family)